MVSFRIFADLLAAHFPAPSFVFLPLILLFYIFLDISVSLSQAAFWLRGPIFKRLFLLSKMTHFFYQCGVTLRMP